MEVKWQLLFPKKTDYIVAGENMGPSKLARANDLEISIISETDYLEMIS